MTPDTNDRDPLLIFESLLDLPPEERIAALEELCPDDNRLRSQVLRLIETDKAEADSDFLAPISGALIGIAEHAIPDQIGPFEIIEPIGEGGFGIVYLAKQSRPIERKIAIKVIKPGMDSRAVIRRFDLERRALAMMKHPHVASVIDGGLIRQGQIGAGRPWFAMEYVDGVPITNYAEEHNLTLAQRLELIIQACSAAQHAHSKAIIHRDIKPSNIMVTELEGKPFCKVIDFGVSKAIENATPDCTLFTSPGAMVGTPQYMSPEQAIGSQDIDIRSDVYSMGMVLYELLTGCPPYEKEVLKSSDLASLRRLIESVDPVRPSSRVQRADGTVKEFEQTSISGITKGERHELDWITMRAIDKDPDRRYTTIAALAQDLERFLRHEPLEAGPPSRSYRIRKFVRRNKVPVILGGFAVAALLLATLSMLFFGLAAEQSRAREEVQRKSAERQAQRVRDINSFLLTDLFSSVDAGVLGPDASLVQLLEEVEPLIGNRFEGDADMLALLHSNFATMNSKTHRYDQALEHADQAVSMLDHATDLTNNQRSTIYLTRATIHEKLGSLDEAESDIRESIKLIVNEPEASEGAHFIRKATLGSVLRSKRKFDEAEPLMREAIEFFEREDADETRRYRSIMLSNYIALLANMRRYDEVEQRINQLLEVSNKLDGRARTSSLLNARYWQTHTLLQQGRTNEAADSSVELVEIARAHEGSGSPFFAVSLLNTGGMLSQADRFQEAIPYLDEGIEQIKLVYGPHHYEAERYTNIIAGYYRDHGFEDEFIAHRQRGLLLRFYVAGPGEQASVVGIMPEGESLMGSMDSWIRVVVGEADSLADGHPKRARFLAHAAVGLQSIGQDDRVEQYLLDAYASMTDAERPDEVRRILAQTMPDYYERISKPDEASRWRERLGDS